MPRCPSTGTALTTDTTPISMTRLDRGPNAVLAILGDMGTPTTMRSAPVTIETGTVFFGAFTGASTLLRDDDVTAGPDCGKFIFNYRASYAQEAQATMEYFKHLGITNFHNMISFDQSDSFGQAGYDGMVAAYKNTNGSFPTTTDSTTPIYRVRYDRNDDTSVPAQVTMVEMHLADLLNAQSGPLTVGIMMTDTYGAATEFIQQLRTWQWAAPQQTTLQAATRLTLQFSNVSFVGANTLSDRLVALGKVPLSGNAAGFTDNVVISQVVPNYQDDTSDVVKAYNTLIANNDDKPSFVSLEGYIAARVFIAGLLIHTGPFTASSIVDSLEALPDLGLGLGATSGFQTPAGQSPNHQYSSTVWGTKLNSDGTFQNLYFWSVGIPIQFPE
jgi:ABC-type branched-subunit amino acid transport system substrate-binding protein